MASTERELTFWLAEPERRLLRAIAARQPRMVTSDHLTVLGVLGALGAATAYALSDSDPAWLWAASGCLVVQWLGDSLDGTVARVRGVERPRYGYYLDHMVDAFSTAVIGLGMGLSPYVNLCLTLGVVIVYLALSINVYLETNVFGVFRLAYGRVGPTELRIALICANAALAVSAPRPTLSLIANATLALFGLGMTFVLVVRVAHNLSQLSREGPARQLQRSEYLGIYKSIQRW